MRCLITIKAPLWRQKSIFSLILYFQILSIQWMELSFQVIKSQIEGIMNLNRVYRTVIRPLKEPPLSAHCMPTFHLLLALSHLILTTALWEWLAQGHTGSTWKSIWRPFTHRTMFLRTNKMKGVGVKLEYPCCVGIIYSVKHLYCQIWAKAFTRNDNKKLLTLI